MILKIKVINLNSKIIKSQIYHQRLGKKSNSFSYNALMFLIDLDELEILNSTLKLFGYNKFGIFKFSDKDYLTQNNLSTFQNVMNWLKKYKLSNSVSKIYSLTTVRFLNHTFNPITIYYILDSSNKIICHIAEVNNTFGDGHVYVLRNGKNDKQNIIAYNIDKTFKVSPLYEISGQYEFRFSSEFKNSMAVHIDLIQNSQKVFKSGFKGSSVEFNDKNLLKFIFKMPLNNFLIIPRILYQAGKMHFIQKIPFANKDVPKHKDTYKASYPPYIRIL